MVLLGCGLWIVGGDEPGGDGDRVVEGGGLPVDCDE